MTQPASLRSDVDDINRNHWTISPDCAIKIKTSDLTNNLAWMRTEFKPQRWNGNSDPLSAKSPRNISIGLRTFYTWLNKEFKLPDPAKEIASPNFFQRGYRKIDDVQ
jgi:hypothetical protein